MVMLTFHYGNPSISPIESPTYHPTTSPTYQVETVFYFSPGTFTYEIPKGATSIEFTVYGASGGSQYIYEDTINYGSTPSIGIIIIINYYNY